MICVACRGRKGGYVPRGWTTNPPTDDYTLVWDRCHLCKGGGVITLYQIAQFGAWRTLGAIQRKSREDRKVSRVEEARRRRITVVQQNAEEGGEIGPQASSRAAVRR